jgi:outer membrane protein OmpA-like peptidoglycan-associated protein
MIRQLAALPVLALLLGSAACGGVTPYTGAKAIAIVGTPPQPEAPPAPAPEPPRVELRDNKIEFKEKIQFDANKATIKPASFSLLHEIAEVIRNNPHVKRIAIEGHASADGDAAPNMKLSRERAKSVRRHLLKKEGIAADALMFRGYGEDKPIADNATLEGREANRRVEFIVVEQDVTVKKVEVEASSGTERVVEEKQDSLKVDLGPDPSAPKKAKKKKSAPTS